MTLWMHRNLDEMDAMSIKGIIERKHDGIEFRRRIRTDSFKRRRSFTNRTQRRWFVRFSRLVWIARSCRKDVGSRTCILRLSCTSSSAWDPNVPLYQGNQRLCLVRRIDERRICLGSSTCKTTTKRCRRKEALRQHVSLSSDQEIERDGTGKMMDANLLVCRLLATLRRGIFRQSMSRPGRIDIFSLVSIVRFHTFSRRHHR